MNRVNKSWALDKSDKLRKGCSPLIFKVTEGFERSSARRAGWRSVTPIEEKILTI